MAPTTAAAPPAQFWNRNSTKARIASRTPHTVAPVEGPDCCGDGGEPPPVTQLGGVVQLAGAGPRSNGVMGPKPEVMNQTTANKPTNASLITSALNPGGRLGVG